MHPGFFRRSLVHLLVVLVLLCGVPQAMAQETDNLLPVSEAYQLTADVASPGVLKLHWTIAPDYYLYRGRMKLQPGADVSLGEPVFPDGEKHHDEYLGDVETYHHAVDAQVPYTLKPGARTLTVSVQYQGCHEVDPKICYPPHTEHLALALPASAMVASPEAVFDPGAALAKDSSGLANPLGAALGRLGSHARPGTGAPLPPAEAFRFEALAQGSQQLLLRWTMPKGYYLYRDQTTLKLLDADGVTLQPAWPAGVAQYDANFGDVTVYFDQLELPVALRGQLAGRRQVQLQASFQGCQEGGLCYPLMTRSVAIDLGAAANTGSAAAPISGGAATTGGDTGVSPQPAAPLQTSLWVALLLALGGGLVLNLMPCVLPVLSIKAVGLLESGENRARARRHALFYSAGVLVSFAVLGGIIVSLRSAGHALGWGTQLQQPMLVGVLALVMLAVGLSMSGMVQFGAALGNTGQTLATRSGPAGDFFTGVLAVVVASPCTAPFMGSALAYAFAAPMLSALLVFLTLGLGLALPFLLIGFVPALARLLPRPGRWMETLKQLLAFPMYLTAVWLAWVLTNQRGADAVGLLLVAAVLLALTLWWFERSRTRGPASRALVVVLAAITLAPLYYLSQVPPPARAAAAQEGIVPYSPAKLAQLRTAGTPVFVDMTADWCVTCKANEHAVLDTEAFRDLLARTGTIYMKGDWTDVNPTIAAFLEQYHSPGVPLYVVFPAGGGDGRQLPTVLTAATMDHALRAAAAP